MQSSWFDTLGCYPQDPTLAQYLVLNGQIFNSLTLAAQRVAASADAQADETAASLVSTIDQVSLTSKPDSSLFCIGSSLSLAAYTLMCYGPILASIPCGTCAACLTITGSMLACFKALFRKYCWTWQCKKPSVGVA